MTTGLNYETTNFTYGNASNLGHIETGSGFSGVLEVGQYYFSKDDAACGGAGTGPCFIPGAKTSTSVNAIRFTNTEVKNPVRSIF